MKLAQKINQIGDRVQNEQMWIWVLEMSGPELTEYLQEISLENPVAELEEIEPDNKAQERLRKLEWLNQFDEQNRIYYQQEQEDFDMDDIVNMGQGKEDTLEDSLKAQLIGKPYSKAEFRVFDYIAANLDSRGYFTDSLADTAVRLGVNVEKIRKCLDIMKNLEPVGVCAKDLSECLQIQLERAEKTENSDFSVEKILITEYMELLGRNQLDEIAEKMDETIERIRQAKDRIRTLEPRPSSGYATREILHYLTPDIIIVKLEDYFEVMVNDCTHPAVQINQEYIEMFQKQGCDDEVRQYLSEKISQIKQIQHCISRRNTILTGLSKFLVEQQKEFFLHGKGHLKPLCMAEAAENLGLEESVAEQAVKEKYLQCCWGTFPLDYFFI